MPRRSVRIRHHPIVSEFGKRLRQARISRGLSQYDLAHRSNLSMNYIGKVERGEVAIGIDTLAHLASGLAVDPSELVSGTLAKVDPLESLKEQLDKRVAAIATRNDLSSVQALVVITGLMDSALARRAK